MQQQQQQKKESKEKLKTTESSTLIANCVRALAVCNVVVNEIENEWEILEVAQRAVYSIFSILHNFCLFCGMARKKRHPLRDTVNE